MKNFAIALFCLYLPVVSQADWSLDTKNSNLSFVSVKNGAVVESHEFKELNGGVDSNGLASLVIALDSVETLIPIRNERMREMLFATNDFPNAEITIQLDSNTLKSLTGPKTNELEVSGNLKIKDQSQTITAQLQVSGLADGGIQVNTTKPILVYASQWGLTPGIEALREVAGLTSITPVVPVMLSLKFVPASR